MSRRAGRGPVRQTAQRCDGQEAGDLLERRHISRVAEAAEEGLMERLLSADEGYITLKRRRPLHQPLIPQRLQHRLQFSFPVWPMACISCVRAPNGNIPWPPGCSRKAGRRAATLTPLNHVGRYLKDRRARDARHPARVRDHVQDNAGECRVAVVAVRKPVGGAEVKLNITASQAATLTGLANHNQGVQEIRPVPRVAPPRVDDLHLRAGLRPQIVSQIITRFPRQCERLLVWPASVPRKFGGETDVRPLPNCKGDPGANSETSA